MFAQQATAFIDEGVIPRRLPRTLAQLISFSLVALVISVIVRVAARAVDFYASRRGRPGLAAGAAGVEIWSFRSNATVAAARFSAAYHYDMSTTLDKCSQVFDKCPSCPGFEDHISGIYFGYLLVTGIAITSAFAASLVWTQSRRLQRKDSMQLHSSWSTFFLDLWFYSSKSLVADGAHRGTIIALTALGGQGSVGIVRAVGDGIDTAVIMVAITLFLAYVVPRLARPNDGWIAKALISVCNPIAANMAGFKFARHVRNAVRKHALPSHSAAHLICLALTTHPPRAGSHQTCFWCTFLSTPASPAVRALRFSLAT